MAIHDFDSPWISLVSATTKCTQIQSFRFAENCMRSANTISPHRNAKSVWKALCVPSPSQPITLHLIWYDKQWVRPIFLFTDRRPLCTILNSYNMHYMHCYSPRGVSSPVVYMHQFSMLLFPLRMKTSFIWNALIDVLIPVFYNLSRFLILCVCYALCSLIFVECNMTTIPSTSMYCFFSWHLMSCCIQSFYPNGSCESCE